MIVTFYSYKGGVGRSMALVNVGEYLARQGVRVVLIDWDLEAPGLERYFPVRREDVEARPGVIDLLIEYREAMAQPPSSAIPAPSTGPASPQGMREAKGSDGDQHVGKQFGFHSPREYLVDLSEGLGLPAGSLSLLPAGQRDGERFASYAARVQGFDWAGFYRDWEGEAYLEWFRKELRTEDNLVLVDSRTGVTEIGGVCVYQLADAVVMLCAANQSNLEGTERMAAAFDRDVVKELRGKRELHILPVPARIPKVEQIQEINGFLNDFADRMGKYYEKLNLDPEAAARRFWIPQIPLYSFRERVAVRETGRSLYRSDDLTTVYGEIAGTIAGLAKPGTALARLGGAREEGRVFKLQDDAAEQRAARDAAVLDKLDSLIAERSRAARKMRNAGYRRKAIRIASPLILVSLLQFLDFDLSTVAAASLPLLYGAFDSLTRTGTERKVPWQDVEAAVQDLWRNRAAFLAEEGDFARRVEPRQLLEERLERTRKGMEPWSDSGLDLL